MPINCADCQGELDPAYFDTRCRECSHLPEEHFEADADIERDGYCERCEINHHIYVDRALAALRLGVILVGGKPAQCGEWQQEALRCEQCERIAANQDSYDDLTPWQQWNR